VRSLGRKSVELLRSEHVGALARVGGFPAEGYGFGLTFAVNLGPGKSANVGSEGEYNWGGAAGTSFWIDPKEHMIGGFWSMYCPAATSWPLASSRGWPTKPSWIEVKLQSAARFFPWDTLRVMKNHRSGRVHDPA